MKSFKERHADILAAAARVIAWDPHPTSCPDATTTTTATTTTSTTITTTTTSPLPPPSAGATVRPAAPRGARFGDSPVVARGPRLAHVV